jgi:2-phosphoglycolate phosphatase
MPKKYIKTAIFDLDGTLIDSKKDIIDSLNHVLNEFGIKEKPAEVIRGYIGRGRDVLVADALGHGVTPGEVEKANQIFDEYYREHMFDSTKLFPGTLEILEYLKDKTLMIVTNKNRDLTVETLKHFKIDKYFNKVIGGDNADCRKPNPCPITNFMYEINVPQDQAIMIGDSDIDIKTGKLAGIATCGLAYGIGRKEDIEKAKPDYILNDIRKLKEIIY